MRAVTEKKFVYKVKKPGDRQLLFTTFKPKEAVEWAKRHGTNDRWFKTRFFIATYQHTFPTGHDLPEIAILKAVDYGEAVELAKGKLRSELSLKDPDSAIIYKDTNPLTKVQYEALQRLGVIYEYEK